MFKRAYMPFLPFAMVLILGLSLAPVGRQAFAQEGVTEEVLADYGSPGIPAENPRVGGSISAPGTIITC